MNITMDTLTANKLITEIFKKTKDRDETNIMLNNIFGVDTATSIWEKALKYKTDELITYIKENSLYPSIVSVQKYIDDICEDSVGIYDDVDDNFSSFTTNLFWRAAEIIRKYCPTYGDIDDLYRYLSDNHTYSSIYDLLTDYLNGGNNYAESIRNDFLNDYPEYKPQPTQVVESNYEEGFELLSFNTIGFSESEMVFALCYANEPAIKIIKGITPMILKRYNVPQEHIEIAGTLFVGQSYSFSHYTIVRLN